MTDDLAQLERRLATDLDLAALTAAPAPPDLAAVRDTAAARARRRRWQVALAVAATFVVAAAAAGAATHPADSTRIDEPAARTTNPPPAGTGLPSTTTTTTGATTTAPPSSTPPATVPGPGGSPGATTQVTPASPAEGGGEAAPPAGGPVADALALRGDGLGRYDFGAPMAAVVTAVTAELGPPTQDVRASAGSGCAAFAAELVWPGLTLTFEGTAADALGLTSWFAHAYDATRTLRMADGPVVGGPLADWVAVYGADYHVNPTYQYNFYIDLAGGRVAGNSSPGDPPTLTQLSTNHTCDLGY